MNEIVPIKFHSVSCNNIKNKTEFVNSWGGGRNRDCHSLVGNH